MSDVFVRSYTHLKDKPNADRALHMLQRIASLVKPIMRKHMWVLPVLSEFFPENPNLLGLNVNGGQKILVRLRPAHSPDRFYPEEDVLQTMLHELTHNVHGPHDEKFYKFLSGLQDEYDALQRSGYAGEGFFSEGKRLGKNVSHNLPAHVAKAKALEAAEKRRQTSRVLGSGGRLGGTALSGGRNLTPREAAAQAAERRARDEKSCGSGELAQREAAKAAKESVESKVIDLTLDEDSDDDVIIVDQKSTPVAGPSKVAIPQSKAVAASTSVKPASANAGKPTTSRLGASGSNKPVPKSSGTLVTRSRLTLSKPAVSDNDHWACPTCTLLNTCTALQCEACLTTRPITQNAGWTCLVCEEGVMPHDFWSCSFCGTVKSHS